jgi:hypothetical protein
MSVSSLKSELPLAPKKNFLAKAASIRPYIADSLAKLSVRKRR